MTVAGTNGGNEAGSTDAPEQQAGRPGLTLPSLGFGASGLGNLYAPVDDATAQATVQAALGAGMGYFDTAPHYGFGLSETRLGELLPREVKISSKVGRLLRPTPNADPLAERHGFVGAAPFEPYFDYSYDGVMRSFEASLKRLKRDRVDILLAHDLGRATHGDADAVRRREFFDGGYKAMRSLRESGVVDAIGLGVNEWQICDAAMDIADFDLFFLAGRYTLLEQTAADRFLPRCGERGVSVVAGAPFNSGILVAGSVDGARYNYDRVPPHIMDRVKRLEAVCLSHDTPLAAAALQFPLAHPQVVCVVPGLSNPEEVRQTLDWIARPIPHALWHDLRDQGLLQPDALSPADMTAPDRASISWRAA